jgi:arabinogalactan oligomer / maltooligosaccharide transport system substrate-binding protein
LNWGDVATWVSAVGALGALAAAIVVAIQTKRIYLLESMRDQIAEDSRKQLLLEQRRSQASRISCWLTVKELPGQSDKGFLAIVVRNASEMPVYSVVLHVVDKDGHAVAAERIAVLPPADNPLELPQTAICDNRLAGPRATENLDVLVSFRDSSGVEWARDDAGRLLEEPALLKESRTAKLLPDRGKENENTQK